MFPSVQRVLEILKLLFLDFWLWIKYGWRPRYKTTNVNFGNRKFKTNDIRSAMVQLSEVFVHNDLALESGVVENIKLIIDCGSNIGITCLYYLENFPNATVVAYEADPKIFEILKSNMPDKFKHRLTLINEAVWIHNDTVLFSQEGSASGNIFDNKNQVSVKSVRLSEMINKLDKIDILKMDIEGAEMDVIQDCRMILNKIDYLFIEYHSFKKADQRLPDLLNILKENGFRYFLREAYVPKMPRFKWMANPGNMDLQLNIYAVKQ